MALDYNPSNCVISVGVTAYCLRHSETDAPQLPETEFEEARELAAQDPAVRAGRLAVDAFTWWTPRVRQGFVTEIA